MEILDRHFSLIRNVALYALVSAVAFYFLGVPSDLLAYLVGTDFSSESADKLFVRYFLATMVAAGLWLYISFATNQLFDRKELGVPDDASVEHYNREDARRENDSAGRDESDLRSKVSDNAGHLLQVVGWMGGTILGLLLSVLVSAPANALLCAFFHEVYCT